MTRILIGLLHLLVALTTLTGALLWAVQMRLNVAWELGFYGHTSIVTAAGLFAVAIATLLSLTQGISGLGWLMGRTWAGYALLGLSFFYAIVLPAPLRWLVMAGGFSIFMELRARRPRPVLPEHSD